MDRIQLGQQGTLNAYWERDGVAWDPDSTTVAVTNDEGVVVASGPALGSGVSGRNFVLPLTATAVLDNLKAVWTAGDSSTLVTYAQVVGDFHFSIAFARTRSPLSDESTYPAAQLLFYRTLAEMALEDICGVAFVPRYSNDVARVTGWGMLELPRRRISKVRNIFTATDSGPQALSTLAGLRIENGSLVFMPSFFNWWSQPINIGYEHGYGFCPPRVARASLELCRRWCVESPWDERATGFRTRDGGEMTILTASMQKNGATNPFDIPEVSAIADAYGTPMIA